MFKLPPIDFVWPSNPCMTCEITHYILETVARSKLFHLSVATIVYTSVLTLQWAVHGALDLLMSPC